MPAEKGASSAEREKKVREKARKGLTCGATYAKLYRQSAKRRAAPVERYARVAELADAHV